MMFLLFLSTATLVFGGPLTREENDDLQQMCGITSKVRFRRSMNTRTSNRFTAPFSVMIHRSLTDGTPRERLASGEGFCTGTIISPRHILTAAHCLGNFHCGEDGTPYVTRRLIEDDKETIYLQKLNYLFVSAPTICTEYCDTMLKGLIAKPKRAFVSEEYVAGGCGYETEKYGDIAIIELQEDIQFTKTVQPACLYTEKVEENMVLTIHGFGITDNDKVDETFGVMRKHKSTTFPCDVEENSGEEPDSWESGSSIQKDEICTTNERTMACGGDSGSGLILSEDNLAYVAAVTSWGPECHPHDPEGYTNMVDVSVGLYYHLDWICAATGICPRRRFKLPEKEPIEEKYVTMELSEDFDLEEF